MDDRDAHVNVDGASGVLNEFIAMRGVLADMLAPRSEAEAIDRIGALEELKAACAAAQARDTVAFDRMRRQDELARGVPARRRGRGVASELALARRESPARGSRALGLARALVTEMPHTMAALTAGTVSEEKAVVMCRETAWLSVQARGQVDALMAERLPQIGARRTADEARAHAQELDNPGAAEHAERCEKERRVSVRPAPGGMAYLTALLPLTQAVAAYANLNKSAAEAVGTGAAEGRGHGQVMADLLVERLTGQATAATVPTEVHLVMTDSALLGDDDVPAWLSGHGPLPAGTARRLLATTESGVLLRRLYTAADTGQLVSMDSRRRAFPQMLRRMVILRDDTCRSPYCDAQIKHLDHATPHRDGGPTSWENASGLCETCNYVKDNPGWQHRPDPGHLEVVTPTGHTYIVTTPPLLLRKPNREPTTPDPPHPSATDPPPTAPDPPNESTHEHTFAELLRTAA